MKRAGAGGGWHEEPGELATIGLAEDTETPLSSLQRCPHLVEVNRTRRRTVPRPPHGSPAAFAHQYLGWWLCTRAIGLAFLIHARKFAFEVVWKAPKEMCLMVLVLLSMRTDSAFHQLFTSAICVPLAPTANGPGYADTSAVRLEDGLRDVATLEHR